MIDTSAIRNKVLALAFQGKLTTYNLADDNVADLYSLICKQRDELIRRKEIKKNKTKAIQDTDIVYEIPVNWMWVRLGEVINLQSGQDLPTVDYNDANKGIPYLTGASNFTMDGSLIINRWTEKPSAYAINGDILLSVKGTVGRLAILHEKKVHIARQIMGIRPIGLNRDFVKYFIQAKIEELQSISKGLIPGIERDNVLNMLMPMPPIEEQKRIVSNVDNICKLLDTIDIFQTQYASNVEVLKSKLIDASIRGKLTEQFPEDGDAEVLYNQIQDEKEKLIKEGKIKKEKTLPEITEDEIPFNIPPNWKWVHWGDLSESIQYGYNAPAKEFGRIKMVRISDIHDNKVEWENVPYCDISEEDISNYLLCENDILFARTGGTVGKSFLVKNVTEDAIYAGYLIRTRYSKKLVPEYMKYFMESQLYWKQLYNGTIATAQPNCNGKTLANMLLPLPPVAEQKRIVDRLQELILYCKTIRE